MDRKDKFKHKAHSVDTIRNKRRHEMQELRKQARHKALNAKRIRCLSATQQEQKEITDQQMSKSAESLVKKEDITASHLKVLYTGAAQGTALISAALSVDNILPTLIGILTGPDASLQYSAARVFCHISAGTHDHAEAILKSAGSYLITYLDSGNNKLQDECAWTLGNIAGDSEKNRATLREMGAIKPLIALLDSAEIKVVQSAAFGLSNLARGEHSADHDNTSDLVSAGIIPKLVKHLVLGEENRALLYEVTWVLTYIAASGHHSAELVESGVVDKLDQLLIQNNSSDEPDIQISTPLLRCLGNLCCGEASVCEQVVDGGKILPCLVSLLTSEHHHIKKECLWVLSNMTSFDKVAELIVQNSLVAPIVELLGGAYDLKKEAAYCVCNIAHHNTDLLKHTLEKKALEEMMKILHSTEEEVVSMGLCYMEMVLKQNDQGVKLVEEANGMSGLELLEYSTNDSLRTHANHILTTYMYKEDGEAETKKAKNGDVPQPDVTPDVTPDSTTTV